MTAIVWDQTANRFYETGIDRGVLYVRDQNGAYPSGVAWNGLISISENPSGAEANPLYADNIKYLNLISAEEFGFTIEAYTYPDAFAECDGSVELLALPGLTAGQQVRKTFGLVYRTKVGNDVDGDAYGYKLHLIYGCQASPSERAYSTINDSPEAITFSWEVTTTPVPVTGFRPTASLVIHSKKVDADKLADLEEILFGSTLVTPSLPLPDAVILALTPDPEP